MRYFIAILLVVLTVACLPETSYSPPVQTITRENTQVYFTKQDQHPELALQALYLSATSSLDIAIYSLTHPIIVKAIGDAYKRGVRVRVISDKLQAAGNTQKHAINDLLLIGIPIKVNTHSGLMHIKSSIVDNKIATTGSFNYSKGASEDNDEMLVVIDGVWFAQLCQQEFNRMWNSTAFKNAEMSY
jgi:phosphatidylserine/phosphatidylglycerophosphate/cardiolipin synthase-like enzyme